MAEIIKSRALEFGDKKTQARVILKIIIEYRDPALAPAEEQRRRMIQKGMDQQAADMALTIKDMIEGKMDQNMDGLDMVSKKS